MKFLNSINNFHKNQKNFEKTLKNHKEKMGVSVNLCMPKIIFMPIKVGILNPLNAKFIKWSNTLKQIVGKLPTICLSVFDHFSGLALKGLSTQRTPIVEPL